MSAYKPPSLLREAVLAAGALLLAGGAAEAYLRAFAPQQLMSPAYADNFGMRGFMANTRIKHQTQDYSVHYTTNDLGFRGKSYPFDKAPGTYRIAVLGASVIFGTGVEDDEVFSERLERRLRAAFVKPRFEVLNFGMMGVSISMDEYLYRELVRRYRPDLVVVHLIYSNKNVLTYEDAKLWAAAPVTSTSRLRAFVRRLIRSLPGYTFLCENSHLYGLRRLALADAVGRKAVDARDADPDAARKFDDLQKTYFATFQALERRVCADHAHFLLLANRGSLEYFPRLYDSLSREAKGSKCLTLQEIDFQEEDVFPHDRHWNPKGHAFLADTLFDFVRGRLKSKVDERR